MTKKITVFHEGHDCYCSFCGHDVTSEIDEAVGLGDNISAITCPGCRKEFLFEYYEDEVDDETSDE